MVSDREIDLLVDVDGCIYTEDFLLCKINTLHKIKILSISISVSVSVQFICFAKINNLQYYTHTYKARKSEEVIGF